MGEQVFGCVMQLPQALHGGGKGDAQGLAHAADEQIPLGAGDGGDALAAPVRLMENDPLRLRSQLVKNQIFRAVQVQPDRGRKEKLLDLVGRESGAVEDHVAGIGIFSGFHQIAVFRPADAQHLRVQQKLRAVLHGVFPCGDAQLPGIHRAGGRSVQGSCHALAEHGLHGFRFRTGQ